MKIDEFKIADKEGDIVNIKLDWPLSFYDAVGISSYLVNNDSEMLNILDNFNNEDIEMVRRCISKYLNKNINCNESYQDTDNNDINSSTLDENKDDNVNVENDLSDLMENEKRIDCTDEFNVFKKAIENEQEQKLKLDFHKLINQNTKCEESEDVNKSILENLEAETEGDSFSNVIQILKDKGYKNIYISGPVRGLGYNVAKRSFNAFGSILKEEGFNIDHTFSIPHPNNRCKEYYIKNGITRMMQADAVVAFNNQIISEGVEIEKDVADAIGMPYYKVNVALVIM